MSAFSIVFMCIWALIFFGAWIFVIGRFIKTAAKGMKRETNESKASWAAYKASREQPTVQRPDVYSQSALPQGRGNNNRKDVLRALDENRSGDWLARQMQYERNAAHVNGLDLGGAHESGICAADWLKETHRMSEHDDSIDNGELS